MSDFLPYSHHQVDGADIDAVVAALCSEHLTCGRLVDCFEAEFAAAANARHAVACNSGTSALHLACMAASLGSGLAAIVPAMTFLATANAVRMTGAEVVFADVDAETGLMTANTFCAALDRAKAAGLKVAVTLPVHLNGQICDLQSIAEMAASHGIILIEDACHALGGRNVGATEYSFAACFSTHPAKAITTGEGGVVTTSNAMRASHMRRLRSHGIVRNPAQFTSVDRMDPVWSYQMMELGWNYRLPEISCALGLSQLRKLSGWTTRRRSLARLYDKLISPLAPLVRPVIRRAGTHGLHLYVVLIDFARLGVTRASVMEWLRDLDIGTQIHYVPVNQQPYYIQRYGENRLPGAEAYYQRCLTIPFFPAMSDEDVHRVAEALNKLVKNCLEKGTESAANAARGRPR